MATPAFWLVRAGLVSLFAPESASFTDASGEPGLLRIVETSLRGWRGSQGERQVLVSEKNAFLPQLSGDVTETRVSNEPRTK
ncbi:hypothetical protein B0H14DRAFT_2870467 [Mycena olivaceomarginata]|nr:hypothetical protein B0H14DRAFT_2870467 [Mycena olivaceomarginata]